MGVGHRVFVEEACCRVSVGEEISLGVCVGDIDELNDGFAVSIGLELLQAICRSVGCMRDIVVAVGETIRNILGIIVARFERVVSADGGIASTTPSTLLVATS